MPTSTLRGEGQESSQSIELYLTVLRQHPFNFSFGPFLNILDSAKSE